MNHITHLALGCLCCASSVLVSATVAYPPVPRFQTTSGVEFAYIPGGTFLMGGPESYVQPRHTVTLSPFYAARTAITKRLFRQFAKETGAAVNRDELGPDPAGWTFQSEAQWWSLPVDFRLNPSEGGSVEDQSYASLRAFARWFSRREHRNFTIVTEAQFEYLARAGVAHGDEDHWWDVDQPSALGDWSFDFNYIQASPVGLANAIPGLYTETPYGLYMYPLDHTTSDGWYEYDARPEHDPHHAVPMFGHDRGCRVVRGVCIWHRQELPPRRTHGTGQLLLVSEILASDHRPPTPVVLPPEPPPEKITRLPSRSVDLGHGVSITMLRVPDGRFIMGRPEAVRPWTNEWPETPVVTTAYWMGRTEVTQAQFKAVMGFNPSRPVGDDLPVNMVTTPEMYVFCELLTNHERAAGHLSASEEYRLPTEAEWEKAAMAGARTRFSYGDDPALLPYYAWFDRMDGVHPVATKRPNAWGFYDMMGNVLEVCGEGMIAYKGFEQHFNWHSYGDDNGQSQFRPSDIGSWVHGDDTVNWYAARGGSWNMGALACEPTMRREVNVMFSGTYHIGFRLVRGPIPPWEPDIEWVAATREYKQLTAKYPELQPMLKARQERIERRDARDKAERDEESLKKSLGNQPQISPQKP